MVRVAEKVREGVKALNLYYEGKQVKVTLSLGVTFLSGKFLPDRAASEVVREKADKLAKVADAALYQAKNEGRDKVIFHNGTV